jgi:hypothetical protein
VCGVQALGAGGHGDNRPEEEGGENQSPTVRFSKLSDQVCLQIGSIFPPSTMIRCTCDPHRLASVFNLQVRRQSLLRPPRLAQRIVHVPRPPSPAASHAPPRQSCGSTASHDAPEASRAACPCALPPAASTANLSRAWALGPRRGRRPSIAVRLVRAVRHTASS